MQIKIAIVSDLHCTPMASEKNTTYLYSDMPYRPIHKNPVAAIQEVIEKDSIRCEYLLCLGDITNKMDKQGLKSGWGYLKELKTSLKANVLVSATGNHDIDSRKLHSHNHIEYTKNFASDYPIREDTLITEYWSDDFFVFQDSNLAIVNYNSCHDHFDENNAKCSNISDSTLEKIRHKISGLDNKLIKIALFHHHPVKYSNLDELYKDGDVLERGDLLIKLLRDNNFDLIIHGHKHIPEIDYFYNVPCFCSGSFSSLENLSKTDFRNTFHVLDLKKHDKCKGKIITWEYNSRSGWIQRNSNRFPLLTGFGAEADVVKLASDINDLFETNNVDKIEYEELISSFPEIEYLIPTQQDKLEKITEEEYNIVFVPLLKYFPKHVFKL